VHLQSTKAGRFGVGTREEIFRHAVNIADGVRKELGEGRLFWALAGGSTPMDWYRWCVAEEALPAALVNASEWFVSDERHVPLSNSESNFGSADRLLLQPLGVIVERKHAWPVDLPPAACSAAFEERFALMRGADRTFDVCFLGLGADGHTASLFPGSPLLHTDDGRCFAAAEVPGKGARLTLTPRGLRACGSIVVMAMGASKRDALARVLAGEGSRDETPARILREISDRVTWLVDKPACEGIEI